MELIKKLNTINATMLVTIAAISIVIIYLLQGSEDNEAPLHVRLKNALHNANTRPTEESKLAVRSYALNNPAVAMMPMKKGSCGYQVEMMQRFMNRFCGQHVVEDGYWGAQTERALWSYYTNENGYLPPVHNRFWAYQNNSFVMSAESLREMIETANQNLL